MEKTGRIKIFSVIFIVLIIILSFVFILAETLNEDDKIDLVNKVSNTTYIDSLRENDIIEVKDTFTKEYTSIYKNIKISEGDKLILDMKLLSPYNNLVGAGEDVLVAEFYLTDYNSLINIFDSINSYDIEDNYEIKTKEYWFKYGVEYIEEECHNLSEFDLDLKEDGEFCQNVTKTNWTRFDDLKELPSKNIKIGLFTDTKLDVEMGITKVEWVGNIKGFNILEWASYQIVGVSTYNNSAGEYSIDGIRALAVTSDGNYLITSSPNTDYVSIMNITNKTSITPLATYNNSAGAYSVDGIRALAVTQDGNYLITSSYSDDYVSIMNITNKTSITPLATYTDSVGPYSVDGISALAVTQDGNYLISSSNTDDYVSIMNITNKTSITPLATYNDSVGPYSIDSIYALAVTSDGNYLITSSYSDDYVSIMNITNKTSITPLATYNDSVGHYSIDFIYALAVTSDGNYLITSSPNTDYVSIMNITNKTSITPLATYTNWLAQPYSIDGIYALAVTSDGNYLITSSTNYDYVSIMNITNKTSITPLATYNNSEGPYSIDGIYALAVTSDGNYLITSSVTDGYVSLMDLIDEGVANTCTYTSGNWNILFSDYCNITGPVDVGGNSITITGAGEFRTTANITGWVDINMSGTGPNSYNVYCLNGGCFI